MMRQYVWGLVVLLATVACSGKKRPFGEGVEGSGADVGDVTAMAPDATPQPGAAGGSSETPPDPNLLGSSEPTKGVPPGSLGASCTTSSQCNAPGFCVDGVCCSSACTELCAACDVPGSVGTCSAAPSDAACGALACAGFGTECRKLDTSQLALNCEAFGACKVNADCAVSNEPSSTTCQAGMGTCNGAGACLVAGKVSLGEACAEDADCAEGHCIAGDGGALVCCDAACDSPCQACSAASATPPRSAAPNLAAATAPSAAATAKAASIARPTPTAATAATRRRACATTCFHRHPLRHVFPVREQRPLSEAPSANSRTSVITLTKAPELLSACVARSLHASF